MKIRDTMVGIFAVVFLVFILITTVLHEQGMIGYTEEEVTEEIEETAKEEAEDSEQEETDLLKTAENYFAENLFIKNNLIDVSGLVLKTAGMRGYYTKSDNISIMKEGYTAGVYNKTSTDYEVKQMIKLKKYLDKKGIQLLYVNEPIKYTNDDDYTMQFGQETYSNQNADEFLRRIQEAGIDSLDLRESMEQENISVEDLFYKTDHHWTVPASRWAAQKIAEKLNEDYGYHIDLSLYDAEQFDEKVWDKSWIGEQGKKVGRTYLGMEDYTVLTPKYETSYYVGKKGAELSSGTFADVFISDMYFDLESNPYELESWHYAYNDWRTHHIHNENVSEGRVLVFGDSYERATVPFLSLGLTDTKFILLRSHKDWTVKQIINQGNYTYDTVIITYAQFMIGAHDDKENANYRMFKFD